MPRASIDQLHRLFLAAERVMGLLSRCCPLDFAAESARLAAALERRDPFEPSFRYPDPPRALADLMRALDSVVSEVRSSGPLGPLYAGRAEELLDEARIVEAIGTRRVIDLARRRFPGPEGEVGSWADRTARAWAALAIVDTESVAAADPNDSRSLLRRLQAEIGSRRLPIRILVTDALMASAATGEDHVYIKERMRHSLVASRRIALHEVVAHAMPRLRAQAEPLGVFRAGTRGASEDEEGRALVLEHRARLMDDARRRELGLRHIAARSVRCGATWVDTARLLSHLGSSPAEAVALASRAHRGGGLAREIVYLPAFRRVKARLDVDPDLENWLARGRVSLDAASYLRAHLVPRGRAHPGAEVRLSVGQHRCVD